MGLIFAALLTLALVLIGLWALSLRGSLARDRQAEEARRREDDERRQQEARQARLLQPGAPLRCLGCGHAFAGPLTDDGCPQCHLAALVVPEEEAHADRS